MTRVLRSLEATHARLAAEARGSEALARATRKLTVPSDPAILHAAVEVLMARRQLRSENAEFFARLEKH